MAISFSRPDPTSPASVRDANFPTARRGFDQQEVRDFLRVVAAELARMQERENFLDHELRSLRQQRPGLPTELDDETLARLLGDETTRIVQAARESAAAIRSKAEDAAERMLREAREEARRLREDAELEASRLRKGSEQDAEAELEVAKQQGREMVEEARAYRERVLGELSRRRDLARQQIDQLIHGRDRLVQAFERARLVAADVVAELAPLGELTEYVNLSPTTGPVPVMVPASQLGDLSSISDDTLAATASADVADPPLDPDTTTDERAAPDEAPSATGETGVTQADEGEHGEAAATAGEPQKGAAEPTDAGAGAEPPAPLSGATVLQFPDRRADTVVVAPGSEVEVDEIEIDEADTDDAEPAEPADDSGVGAEEEVPDDYDITANDVDSLFARLRTDSETGVEPQEPADAVPAVEPTPFQRRDETLTPLIVGSARKLKRVLADEQNDVLDRLRGTQGATLEELLPGADEHVARYFDAIASELAAAAEAGASSLGGVAGDDPGPLAAARQSITDDLVGPLRERLAERIDAANGDREQATKSVRAVYREWKTRRIDDHLDDLFRVAHGRGVLAALAAGEPCRWAFDPEVGACSDCEDNSLQGAVPAGTPFPTGHVAPPAHTGCRCLVQRA